MAKVGLVMVSLSGFALADTFHGWSKDGSYVVYETPQRDERPALFFCKTTKGNSPSWPAELNDTDLVNDRLPECVRFIDVNKAPYLWKKALILPEPAQKFGQLTVRPEFAFDGEEPGLVVDGPGGPQSCYVSALTESSTLEKTWWHPSQPLLAALVSGRLTHCQLKATPKAGQKAKPPTSKPGRKPKR
jgi:hypothetical protein